MSSPFEQPPRGPGGPKRITDWTGYAVVLVVVIVILLVVSALT